MGDRKERPYQYRSALQLKPQGGNGATGAVLEHHSHLRPPCMVSRHCVKTIGRGLENQSPAISEKIEHGRYNSDDPGTWGGELGQPVRNT